jgi:hypothetical protein
MKLTKLAKYKTHDYVKFKDKDIIIHGYIIGVSPQSYLPYEVAISNIDYPHLHSRKIFKNTHNGYEYIKYIGFPLWLLSEEEIICSVDPNKLVAGKGWEGWVIKDAIE